MRRKPRPVYELEGLCGQHTDGQFYTEEPTSVRITKQMTYKVDKILDKRVRCGILEYLVRWRWYSAVFDSWIPVFSIKNT